MTHSVHCFLFIFLIFVALMLFGSFSDIAPLFLKNEAYGFREKAIPGCGPWNVILLLNLVNTEKEVPLSGVRLKEALDSSNGLHESSHRDVISTANFDLHCFVLGKIDVSGLGTE